MTKVGNSLFVVRHSSGHVLSVFDRTYTVAAEAVSAFGRAHSDHPYWCRCFALWAKHRHQENVTNYAAAGWKPHRNGHPIVLLFIKSSKPRAWLAGAAGR